MGIFGRKRDGANHRTGASSSAEPESRVPLADPGLPDHDSTQIAHNLFLNSGLMYVAYGPGPIDELFSVLSRVAPVFARSGAGGSGIGFLGGNSEMPWVAMSGTHGSVVALFAFPGADVNLVMTQVAEPLKKLPRPWCWTLGTKSNQWSPAVAAIIDSSRVVPMWDLSALAHTRPEELECAVMPEAFKERLREHGWTQGNGDFFSANIRTQAGRVRDVHLMSYNANSFAVMSVVCATAAGGSLPPPLRGCDIGEFMLKIVSNEKVFLLGTLPVGPPSPTPSDVQDVSVEVGNYAERLAEDLGLALDPARPTHTAADALVPTSQGEPGKGLNGVSRPGQVEVRRTGGGSVLVSWIDAGLPGSQYKVSRQEPDGSWRVVGRTGALSLEDGGAGQEGPLPVYTVEAV